MNDPQTPIPVPPVLGATPPDASGVCCPKCRCRHMPAQRSYRRGEQTIRRRRCRHCGTLVTTAERIRSKPADGTP